MTFFQRVAPRRGNIGQSHCSLKKPFNLGFKAFPGREFNLRDLRFSMLGVCILSVGFSIPSPLTTREYPSQHWSHNQRIPPASRHKYRK